MATLADVGECSWLIAEEFFRRFKVKVSYAIGFHSESMDIRDFETNQ